MRKKISSKGLNKKKQIGRAAAKLFNRKGYLETSVDDIAALANTSKGSLYYYFSTKEEILFFILSNYMDVALKNLDAELQQIENGFSKLQFFISRHIDLYVSRLDESKTLLHETHCLSKKHQKYIAEQEKQYARIVSELLKSLFDSHNVPDSDEITVVTFLLFGMCNWAYHWYDPKGSVKPDRLSQIIWRIYLEGIKGLGENILYVQGEVAERVKKSRHSISN